MNNLSNFFPETVYFCDCLQMIIEKCKKPCSLQDLCNEINDNDDSDGEIIYCAKCCKKKDVVFSCCNHIAMGTFRIQYTTNNAVIMKFKDRHFCLICIKKYLQKDYHKFNCRKLNTT